MTDVIQQAREALGFLLPKWEDDWAVSVTERQLAAFRAFVEAADGGYLIDTRRIEALSAGERVVCLIYEPGEPWPWEADGESAVRRGKTAAAALAAAEREAG